MASDLNTGTFASPFPSLFDTFISLVIIKFTLSSYSPACPLPSSLRMSSVQLHPDLPLLILPSIYISGDTLLIPELASNPQRYPHIDLLLIHLGGTTIPHPSMPMLMVTMDGEMGVQLVQLVQPDLTIPIHYE